MTTCVSVVIDDITSKIDKPYDYCVPEHLVNKVKSGLRAVVPFSKANIKKKALIIKVFTAENSDGLKEIIDISDDLVHVKEFQISLIELLKKRYFVTYHKAYKTIIPRGADIKIKRDYIPDSELELYDAELYGVFKKHHGTLNCDSVPEHLKARFDECIQKGFITEKITADKSIGELTEKHLLLKISKDELESYISDLDKRFQKQIDLLSVFLDFTDITEKDALYYSGCSQSTLKTLVRKGLIDIERRPVARNPYKDLKRDVDNTPIILQGEQQSIYKNIVSSTGYNVHLINGVTGSGKTMVYMALMDYVMKAGKSVIFMVPEISLTPQTLAKFYSRYGDIVSVVHSGLAPGERADEWRKISKLDCSITVGTRSAVFSPVNNLGLIIIDEEHEACYKSESAPRYHARDIAKFICKKHNIPLILGSATPSIESAYYAERGLYRSHFINTRYNNNPLPEAEIIDMRDSTKEGNQSFLSDRLKEAISDTLANGEQVILFLNRRGAHTMVGCRSCGYVAKCPSCGVALTYHLANNRCMCHYCGYNIKMFSQCPECSSEHIKKLGFGTQLVYSDLCYMFPDAKILRMDFDTIDSYLSYGNKLNSFRDGEYNIMLGTQMVAKGLDFPNVTLVGVINADLSLYVDDFRANERTYSLLTQVCGRSGRADKIGKAYIQTYSPDYEVINYAKEQDYKKYYNFELQFRRLMNYPPFCDIIQFTVSNKNENKAHSDVIALYELINSLSKADYSDIPVRLLYPVPPRIPRFNDKYRYNLVVKTRISKRMYECLEYVVSYCEKNMQSDVILNINPINNI